MDSPFGYDKYVTGKYFVGRKQDCNILSNLLSAGESIAIYETPKFGKRSLIQQTLLNMRISGKSFIIGEFTMLNVREISQFLIKLVSTSIRATATTQDEYVDIINNLLSGSHFVFDKEKFAQTGEVVSLTEEPDDTDIIAATLLPYLLAKKSNTPIYIIINEFQNIDLTEDGDKVYKAMERVLKQMQREPSPKCSYIFCGSMVNAMASVFEKRHYFHRVVERLKIRDIETKEFCDHIVRSFLSGGKVIDRELLSGVCRLFKNHPGYINHFISLCNSFSKGYITEAVLLDALDTIISIHEPKFKAIMNDLTTYQVSLLRAVIDGYQRFSSAEVISKYKLNSSANVKRLREALMKKEILSFDEEDNPFVLDPLFEYWVTKYFFCIKKDL